MDWNEKISRKDFIKILFSVILGVLFGNFILNFFKDDNLSKKNNSYGSQPYGGSKN